jgi:hypothetical protein
MKRAMEERMSRSTGSVRFEKPRNNASNSTTACMYNMVRKRANASSNGQHTLSAMRRAINPVNCGCEYSSMISFKLAAEM